MNNEVTNSSKNNKLMKGIILTLLIVAILLCGVGIVYKYFFTKEDKTNLNDQLIISKTFDSTIDNQTLNGFVLGDFIKKYLPESYKDNSVYDINYDITFKFNNVYDDNSITIKLKCVNYMDDSDIDKCREFQGGLYINTIKIKDYNYNNASGESYETSDNYSDLFDSDYIKVNQSYLILQNSIDFVNSGYLKVYQLGSGSLLYDTQKDNLVYDDPDFDSKPYEKILGVVRSYSLGYDESKYKEMPLYPYAEGNELYFYTCEHSSNATCEFKSGAKDLCQYVQKYSYHLNEGAETLTKHEKIEGVCNQER